MGLNHRHGVSKLSNWGAPHCTQADKLATAQNQEWHKKGSTYNASEDWWLAVTAVDAAVL